MKSNRWDDHYARRARAEKWLARSVYKLQEIDRKFKLIRKGHQILDLGCYPGSWSQYGISKVGPEGDVIGIDLNLPDRLSFHNFRSIQADILALDMEWLIRKISPRDLVMSDLAPSTTGIGTTDTSRSMALAKKALDIASVLLKRRGYFVCKVLEGEEIKPFRLKAADIFSEVRLFRPKATRKRSREVYLIGQQFV